MCMCVMTRSSMSLQGLCIESPWSLCADPEGGSGSGGPDPLLKNKNNIGCLSKYWPGSPNITKLPSQHSILGHHRYASETPFKWRFAGGPMMARL